VMIGGTILGGHNGSTSVVFRALGPSLAARHLSNVLGDPVLDLRNENGTRVRMNDDWQDDPAQVAQLTSSGLAPSDSHESAIAITLAPAAYTAIVSGETGEVGLALVEVYSLSQ